MTYGIREPSLHATPVLELRPTQMTLGMREVALKRKSWKTVGGKKLAAFLAHHMAPVVIGPGQQRFLIDHHHLARALHDEGVDSVFVVIVDDFHRLDADAFWNIMEFHGWTHPYDAKGRRRGFADLPKTVKDMEDDPYRSLAGELRNIRRLRQGFDAVLGIRLGRLPASPHQAEGRAQGLRRRAAARPRTGQDRGGGLPARLVRPPRRGGDRKAGRTRQEERREEAPRRRAVSRRLTEARRTQRRRAPCPRGGKDGRRPDGMWAARTALGSRAGTLRRIPKDLALPSTPHPARLAGRPPRLRWAGASSPERHDLPHADTLAQTVEAFVDLVEPQPVGQQLVDRQAAGLEQRDEMGQVAARHARADV